MGFEIVQMIEGAAATIYTDSIDEAVKRLGLTLNGVETRTNLRPCLQRQPKISGYVGPCYGGNIGGMDVIRYEDRAVYQDLSL